MKKKLLLLGALALITGFQSSAMAQSVFLLQLGSFPSEEQATERWESLKSAHSDILSPLSLRIAQVALPPDNAIIYRTQAGPIENRADAVELCRKLTSTKNECFVVETAMFVGQDSVAAITPPKPTEPSKPAVASVIAENATPPAVSSEKPPEATIAPTPVIVAEAPQPRIERTPDGKIIQPSAALMAESIDKPVEITPPSKPEVSTMERLLPWLVSSDKKVESLPETPSNVQIQQNAEPRQLMVESVPETAPALPPQPVFVPPPAKLVTPVRIETPRTNMVDSGAGNVDVAEAIRVPVSDAQPRKLEPRPLGLGGFPSQNLYHKTLWVQLNYFPDQQNALAFWDEYRYANKDATAGIRVRVTQPYYFARGGRVSLRVGPFSTMDDVNNLCTSAKGKNLTCATVQDIGSSVAANAPRDRHNYRGYDERSRMQAWNIPSGTQVNWVQLGSYTSPEQAWNDWNRLKDSNPELLGKMGADVNTANLSSSAKQTFRLRAGPFMTRMAAINLCDRLESKGIGCVIVSTR